MQWVSSFFGSSESDAGSYEPDVAPPAPVVAPRRRRPSIINVEQSEEEQRVILARINANARAIKAAARARANQAAANARFANAREAERARALYPAYTPPVRPQYTANELAKGMTEAENRTRAVERDWYNRQAAIQGRDNGPQKKGPYDMNFNPGRPYDDVYMSNKYSRPYYNVPSHLRGSGRRKTRANRKYKSKTRRSRRK